MPNRLFLARTEEQKKFRQVLQSFQIPGWQKTFPTVAGLLKQDQREVPVSPHIFLLYGEGGMGKSSLSRRLREIAQQEFGKDFNHIWLDWEDEKPKYPSKLQVGKSQIQPESILDILHAKLGEIGSECKQYFTAKKKLEEIEEKIDRELKTQERAEEYRELIGGGLTVALNVLRLHPQANAAITAVDALGATEVLKKSGALALTKLIHQQLSLADRRLYVNPTMQLAQALGEGLAALTKKKPLVIFLDTYEIVDRPECDYGLREVIKSAGTNVVWVIAGRADLTKTKRLGDKSFRGYEQDFEENLYPYPLKEFSGRLVAEYFQNAVTERPLPEDGAERIAVFSFGIPFVVSQIADIWKTAPEVGLEAILERPNDEGLEESGYDRVIRLTSQRFLKHCFAEKAPEDLKMICAIALLRQPNIELLRAMLQQDELEIALSQLQQRHSFILLDGKIRLHNKIEDFLKEALRSPEILFSLQIRPQMLTELNELAVMFLQDELAKRTENLPREHWYEDDRIAKGLLDLVHHLFWLDEDRGWAETIPRFLEAWQYDYRWAESLLEVIDDFSGRLCSLGKKRLGIFQAEFEAGSEAKETQAILDELQQISRQYQWLAGEGKEERDLILMIKAGWVKQSQSRYEEALEIYLAAERETSPEQHKIRARLGRYFDNVALSLCLQEKPNYDLAVASYDKALEIKPDKHEAWNNRGIALDDLGRQEEAIASYDKALEIKPDKDEAWNNRGNALGNLGRYEEAIASYDKALEIKPDYHRAWNNRGVALGNLGRNEEAIASYDKALEIKPDDHEAWYNRGVALSALGRKEEAIASYDKALEIKPDDHEAWYNRGNALGNLGRYEEAIASYDKALEIKPDYHEAWNNRGNALGNLGRYEEAIASYDKALEIKPDYHEVWNNRGIALSALGRYEEAIASYDKALEIKPDYASAYYNKACLFALQNNIETAIELLKKSIELDSENRDIAKTDRDFDSIRDDPRFQALIQGENNE